MLRLALLSFAAGIAWLQCQPQLPSSLVLAFCAAGACLSAAIARWEGRWRWLGCLAGLLLGIAWSGLVARDRMAEVLAEEAEGRDQEVVGVVSSLPQRIENGVRFDFSVEQSAIASPRLISLAWYQGLGRGQHGEGEGGAVPVVHAGERWRLLVRLKRPHGNVNPHGVDFEGWLLERGIRATGYVRMSPSNGRLDEFVIRPGTAVEWLRERIRMRMELLVPEGAPRGVMIALVVGDQQAIDGKQWRVFANTGTTHLMSISGLHVTMVASLGWWLIGWTWRRSGWLMRRVPAQRAAALAGFLTALCYCLLAGFAVPAQRTLYMLGVVAAAMGAGREFSASRVLAAALGVVLLLDPWAVLAPGFWLSFGAVALLFWVGAGGLAKPHWLQEWWQTQWAVTIGSLPALLILFQQFSLVSPVANAVAIPVVSYLATPLALAGALPPFDPLLVPANFVLTWLLEFLGWLANLPMATWQQAAPPLWAVVAGLAGTLWLLLPRGFPARWLGIAGFLPLIFLPAPRPATGEAWIRVLDVGQGLAVHVQTASHDLLYDTGPAYGTDANSGTRIILPYLRALGVRRLDMLVVTHQDRDHSGGAESVLDAVPVATSLSSLPLDHRLVSMMPDHHFCAAGQQWLWEGVVFQMIYPLPDQEENRTRKTNDMSCVLAVTAGNETMLLTSDIEALSERRLLSSGERLSARVMLVPHHGSTTSSTGKFIDQVGPTHAVVPAGYRNRFHHPREEVLLRYQQRHTTLWRTDLDGAVLIRLRPAGSELAAARAQAPRYWFSH